ncbi:hypothetical protein WK24_24230 [Burkholderia vietnamiensis]|jgi:hypothetical protein|nr:hypothetical protein WK24_24230 [Burkholderia vietnamiensis]OQD23085.1 hypothetical protein UE98_15930 [Burkholderia cenocepacia]PRE01354.1 hypothetical protein C6P91_24340 [Burkholderia multivorans]PRG13135.1 hypothetical protein C6Q17_12115 [Burkholderia contaminans]KVS08804.1 hypothetical protein WK32_08020 [Burkholderia vietnamiensis]
MEWRAFDLPICLAQDRLEVWAIVGIKLADTIALRARHTPFERRLRSGVDDQSRIAVTSLLHIERQINKPYQFVQKIGISCSLLACDESEMVRK